MPKFVVMNSFLHKHVLHPGGEVLELSEYEARKMGHNLARVADEAANGVKQESAKAEDKKPAAGKSAPPTGQKQAAAKKASVPLQESVRGRVPPPPPDRWIKKGGA